MLFLVLATLSHGVIEAARNVGDIAKPVLRKSADIIKVPVAAVSQHSQGHLWPSQTHKQVELLPPAEGLHPKRVFFPGSPGGASPTHYLYHEPPGCMLPQQPLLNAKGPLTPAGKSAIRVKGVFLLLHGCGYNSDDWFALPEEVYMVRDLLSRGFLLAAPDATPGQPGGCWSPGLDAGPLMYSFGLFRNAFGLGHLPLYAVGTSSGGVILSSLVAQGVSFAGTMYIVSPGTAGQGQVGTFALKNHPPSAFVLMPPDRFGVKADIMAAVSALQGNGVPVATFEVQPKPVHVLLDRAEAMRIDKGVMRQMVSDISNKRFCQQKAPGSFFLLPAYSDVAYNDLMRHYALTAVQAKALWQELKVIEGVHSTTAEHFSESIDFLLTSQHSVKAVFFQRMPVKSITF